ncbi:nitrogen regulatory IIA protein [Flavobacterium sp. ST-75]|uniref:Nitrogen regulatory IIA protein n=1 Tax=Flavobacterium rhizophilum TaxID=3163296 RepID=A0ABW8YAF6_9FLAO
MEKFHSVRDTWQDRLDSRWRQLPARQRRRIVLYSFAGYLLVTAVVVVQVVNELGNARRGVGIQHISNPVAGEDRPVKTETIIQELKKEDYERKQ